MVRARAVLETVISYARAANNSVCKAAPGHNWSSKYMNVILLVSTSLFDFSTCPVVKKIKSVFFCKLFFSLTN